ncbi:MarR family winged helix-turn-helix transcriptional regulator [Kineosporia succinea]|uniref:DNA-binding MarR family transcriptional regulator n=1 Tax=Kineosporia succinea TaxID=84632 RepID=A0ABT9P470_9ACTN|nr:MarR family transcriptional regulator [Kineosporia succinea]MDP9826865.1 DNA-binding MarR family transcriptional regulator [Kineosporia succinea]
MPVTSDASAASTAVPASEKADDDLIELAASLDGLLSFVRRNTPPSGWSMTARTTVARLAGGGPARVSDLAKLEGVTQPAMTGLVNRLEGEGLVRREPDPSDARAWLVELTESGHAFVLARRAQRTRMLAERMELLDPADQAALLAAGPAIARLVQSNPL